MYKYVTSVSLYCDHKNLTQTALSETHNKKTCESMTEARDSKKRKIEKPIEFEKEVFVIMLPK